MNDELGVGITPPRMHSDCIREIQALEARQHRPLRAIAMNPDDAQAHAVLAELESAIALLRDELRAMS